MEALLCCTNENDDDEGKQNSDDVDAFLERHDAEASSIPLPQSPENQNQDQDESNNNNNDAAAVVGSALRLARAHVGFLGSLLVREGREESGKEKGRRRGTRVSQCGRRRSMVLKRRTLSAHALRGCC